MLVRTRTIFGGFTGFAIVVLTGCGGGGGDSDPVPPLRSVSNVTFDGTAAKGIINLGNVVRRAECQRYGYCPGGQRHYRC